MVFHMSKCGIQVSALVPTSVHIAPAAASVFKRTPSVFITHFHIMEEGKAGNGLTEVVVSLCDLSS